MGAIVGDTGQGLKVRKGWEKELRSGFRLLCRDREKQKMHFLEYTHPSQTHTRVSKFLSVIFMKPFGDMIQASSCRFFHVLLKIQITE